ncbi:hypothetical protein Hanom_Chr00s000005g01612221 [Helianthus anomalus]
MKHGYVKADLVGLILGVVCFFRGKMSAVCGPHLQTSAAEEVGQTSSVCKKKTVCFSTAEKFKIHLCKFDKIYMRSYQEKQLFSQ